MFSKKAFALLIALALGIGCSKGEVPADQVNFKYGSTGCFKGMGQRFQDFFKGVGTASDMQTNWTCMSQILNDFSRINETSSFPKDDLKNFLNDHYNLGLTSDIMQSVMKLKQVLAGGDLNSISKTEIDVIVQDLNALEAITSTLAPFTRTLFGDANAQGTDDQWNLAYMTFAGQLPKLAALLSRQNLPYAFADLKTFALALADQFGAAGDSFIRKLGDLVPAFASAKVLLIAGGDDQMTAKEWLPLLAQVGNAYLTYQSVMRAIDLHPNDASLALADPRLAVAVQNIVQLLNSSVQARPNKQIAFTEISGLLAQLEAAKFFPKSFTAAQAESALEFLILRIFPATNASEQGLDALHVNEMQTFVTRWKTVQVAYTQGQAQTIPDLALSIQPSANWNLNLDDNGRLILPQGKTSTRLEFPALFTVLEWLGQKWGAWPLGRDQFHAAVTDLLGLIHSFNYLMSTDHTIYLRLLREANLFMPGSNGNMQLELNEAFQYALFALSSYRNSHALILAANKACGDDDFFCFQKTLSAHRANLFSNLPNLNQWLGTDPLRYDDFMKDVNTIVGSSELMEFMVLNYIETFMQRFDADHDGLITLPETKVAFKVYGSVLTEMLADNGIKPEDVGPLFAWLFAYGKKPGGDIFDDAHWLWWKLNSSSWSCSADRKTLASILAELIKM